MTNVQQLHIQIAHHLQTLKRELDRLTVRASALERCRKAILVEKANVANDSDDEEREEFDDLIANVDAIEYDLTTFKAQMKERLAHAESGLRLVSVYTDEKNAGIMYQYILDGVTLCIRDAATAREGYDELIANINDITHLRDV
jgi:soluble cytochrome b562